MEYTIVIIAFLLGLLGIGFYVSKKIKNEEDFWIAGRGLGIIPLIGSYFATIVSAVSVVGYTGYYYNIGWGGWWNWAGTAMTSLICAFWFAARIRRFGKVTLPDYLEARYGKAHAFIAAAIILVAMIFFTAAQLTGSAAVVTTAIGMEKNLAILLCGAVFIIFTVMGGMESVAWTDVLCTFVILIGVFILAIVAVGKAGGIAQIHTTLAQTKPEFLDPFAGGKMTMGIIVSWIVTWGIGNFGAAQFITRFYSAKSPEDAAISQGYTGLVFLFLYIPLMLAALAGAILFPGIKGADNVTPFLIKELLNPWFGGIVMAGILAAAISTASGVLLMAGTTFVRDFYQKFYPDTSSAKLLKMSRVVTTLIGILAIGFTMTTTSTVMWIQANMVGIMGSALSMIVIFGFIWKRANSQGAMASMIVGIATAVIWYALDKPFGWFPILPSIITSSIALFVVSLMTAPPPASVVEEFFGEASKK